MLYTYPWTRQKHFYRESFIPKPDSMEMKKHLYGRLGEFTLYLEGLAGIQQSFISVNAKIHFSRKRFTAGLIIYVHYAGYSSND